MPIRPDLADALAVADPARKVLLKGGYVVTMDPALGDFVGDVLVVGDTIEAVAPSLGDVADALVIDVGGAVVLPGLIDSHVHAWQGALRGIAPDADFNEYGAIAHAQLAPQFLPEDVAVGTRMTVAQALNNGVTTIIDNFHNSRSLEHSEAALETLVGSGIRAVHAVGSPAVVASPPEHLPGAVLELRDRYASSPDSLVTLRQFDLTPTLDTWRYAAENGLGIVAELGVWMPGIDDLLASEFVGPTHTYNHVSGLSRNQWQRIADGGAAVNLVPRSDSHYGISPFVPVLEANRLGIQEGISTDMEISYGSDLFTEMKLLQAVQRGLVYQARYAGNDDAPALYGPRDVLRAATVGGALNADLPGTIGTLTPGKKADIVVLDLSPLPTRHFGSVLGTVVNFASAANVDGVLVGGIAKKWGGRLVGVDEDALVTAAENSRARLLAAVGVDLDQLRLATNFAFTAPAQVIIEVMGA